MKTAITLLASSLLCLSAAAGTFSSYTRTNALHGTDLLLIDSDRSDLGAGKFQTMSTTLRTLAFQPGNTVLTNLGGIGSTNYIVNTNQLQNALEVVTISPLGTNNSSVTTPNNGLMFGPDTPGTTTCGIQEAFNALTVSTNYGPYANGITMRFAPGYFFYTNALVFSNQYPVTITLQGDGFVHGKLVYAGSGNNINCITFKSGVNWNAGSISKAQSIVLRDLGFSALWNTTNTLIKITNCASFNMQFCNLTSWEIMTNQSNGGSVTIVNNSQTMGGCPVPGLV